MATSGQERTIPATNTFVKYDNPVLVSENRKKAFKDTASTKIGGTACKIQTTTPTADIARRTVEILNEIFPPKEWEADGQMWIQQVSSTPATRLDVINLLAQLDMRMEQKQAKKVGLCSARRELHAQCFDEVIRQGIVNCPERGLLLLRIKDEMTMTLIAYKFVHQSGIRFGNRKALQAEPVNEELIAHNEMLQKQIPGLERTIAYETRRLGESERKASALAGAIEKRHKNELEFMQKTQQRLKTQLAGMTAPKGKLYK